MKTHNTQDTPENTSIEFVADKVKINGPKIDNGYAITFEVGEYQQQQVAELLNIKIGQMLKVSVKEE